MPKNKRRSGRTKKNMALPLIEWTKRMYLLKRKEERSLFWRDEVRQNIAAHGFHKFSVELPDEVCKQVIDGIKDDGYYIGSCQVKISKIDDVIQYI